MTQFEIIGPTLGIGAVIACLICAFINACRDHNMGPDDE